MVTEDDLSRTKTPPRMRRGRQVIFGYHHVQIPPQNFCPCRDPGNYLMMELLEDGTDQLRCWCGRTMKVTFDSPEERREFIETGR